MTNRFFFSVMAVLFMCLAITVQPKAATLTTSMPVTATGVSACSVSTTGVAFGSYSGATVTSSGSITVTCGVDVAYNVTLDRGLFFFTGGSRHMNVLNLAEGTFLAYSLYKDSALTQEWGDAGFAGTYQAGTAVAGTGTGAVQTLTVFGKIPAGQTVMQTVHSDTVLVSLIF